MKKLYVLFFFLLSTIAHAQVTQFVNFDNYLSVTDNDLVNNFEAGSPFVQIDSNGISGGALVPPAIGGNFAILKRKYQVQSNNSSFSVYFKYYDSLDKVAGSFTVELKLDLKSAVTGNALSSYVQAYVYKNSLVVGNTGSKQSINFTSTPLKSGHWYQLVMNLGLADGQDSLRANTYLYDYGTDGKTFSGVFKSIIGQFIYAQGFSDPQTYVDVDMIASKGGGTALLDNYNVASNFPLSVSDKVKNEVLIRSDNRTVINIGNPRSGRVSYQLYDMSGHVLRKGYAYGAQVINIEDLPPAMYFLKVSEGALINTKKIVKN